MGAATVVTLIGVFVAVAAVAIYLIIIAYTLNKVSFTVGTVLIGVRAIASQTQPLGSVVRDIYNDVAAINEALSTLVSGSAPRRALRPPGRARAAWS